MGNELIVLPLWDYFCLKSPTINPNPRTGIPAKGERIIKAIKSVTTAKGSNIWKIDATICIQILDQTTGNPPRIKRSS